MDSWSQRMFFELFNAVRAMRHRQKDEIIVRLVDDNEQVLVLRTNAVERSNSSLN